MAPTTITARIELWVSGMICFIPTSLTDQIAVGVMQRFSDVEDEEGWCYRDNQTIITVAMEDYQELLKRNFGILQVDPCLFSSLDEVMKLLREMTLRDILLAPATNEINTTEDGRTTESLYTRMRLFMELLGISPYMVHIR